MQKFLQKEQLAREDHILYIPGAKVFEIRAEQGLPKLALPTTDADFLQSRMHSICVGEIEGGAVGIYPGYGAPGVGRVAPHGNL